MARSIEEIFNSMVAEKQNYAVLSGLMPQYNLVPPTSDNPFRRLLDNITSYSRVSIWRLYMYVVATAIHLHEVLWDAFRKETEEIAASSIAGNLPWYAAQVKAWQYGFVLFWNSAAYRYYYLDSTSTAAVAARLVAKVSVKEQTNAQFNGVVIKVAKEVGGTLVPLNPATGSELDSLTYYVSRVKFAGLQTAVLSDASDKVKLNIKLYYNGTLELAPLKVVVEAAIKNYLRNIDFDGVLFINELVDAIQLIEGIVEPWVRVNSVECRRDSDTAYTLVTERYEPVSGYFELIPLGNTAADSIITYEAV